MNNYLQIDPWCIIEEGFNADKQLATESIFSLANGHIGQRANFEEYYSGETLLGSYISGGYYQEPDQDETIKNDETNTENQLLNTPNWSGIIVRLNDEILDLATWKIENFRRVLNMHEGFLERTFDATSIKGHKIQVAVKRFLSMAETEIGAISYSVKSLNYEGRISFMPVIDADIKNMNLKNKEQLWNVLQIISQQDVSHLWAKARRINFQFCGALSFAIYKNNEQLKVNPTKIEKERVAGFSVGADVRIGDNVCLNKYFAIIDSLNLSGQELTEYACTLAKDAKKKGWNQLFDEHTAVWAAKWLKSDVVIEGDMEAQQAIRHKIFRTIQTLDSEKNTTSKI